MLLRTMGRLLAFAPCDRTLWRSFLSMGVRASTRSRSNLSSTSSKGYDTDGGNDSMVVDSMFMKSVSPFGSRLLKFHLLGARTCLSILAMLVHFPRRSVGFTNGSKEVECCVKRRVIIDWGIRGKIGMELVE